MQNFFNAVFGQRLFVPGLRCGQHIQVVALLVFDQGLVEVRLTLNDIDQVIHHPAFAAHDQVQVAQAHIKVDNRCFVPAQSQAGRKTGAGGGFSHAAFAGGDHNDFCHERESFL